MDTIAEPVSTMPRRSVATWIIGFFGVVFGVAVAMIWHKNETDSLSSRELSLALGIHHWRYIVPNNDGSQFLSFELRDGDEVKTSGGSSGWTSGEAVTITARPLMDSRKLECSIIGKKSHGRYLLDNPFASLSGIHYADDGAIVNEIPLIKGNRNGPIVIVPMGSVEAGDVSLRVVMAGPKTDR